LICLLPYPDSAQVGLTFPGIGLALGNWISFGLMLATSLIGYGYRAYVEEKAPMGHFGRAYERFARTRWRLIPPLY
jgi:protein-S-isoprenylcysteine O-methyltransferase Ste14